MKVSRYARIKALNRKVFKHNEQRPDARSNIEWLVLELAKTYLEDNKGSK